MPFQREAAKRKPTKARSTSKGVGRGAGKYSLFIRLRIYTGIQRRCQSSEELPFKLSNPANTLCGLLLIHASSQSRTPMAPRSKLPSPKSARQQPNLLAKSIAELARKAAGCRN